VLCRSPAMTPSNRACSADSGYSSDAAVGRPDLNLSSPSEGSSAGTPGCLVTETRGARGRPAAGRRSLLEMPSHARFTPKEYATRGYPVAHRRSVDCVPLAQGVLAVAMDRGDLGPNAKFCTLPTPELIKQRLPSRQQRVFSLQNHFNDAFSRACQESPGKDRVRQSSPSVATRLLSLDQCSSSSGQECSRPALLLTPSAASESPPASRRLPDEQGSALHLTPTMTDSSEAGSSPDVGVNVLPRTSGGIDSPPLVTVLTTEDRRGPLRVSPRIVACSPPAARLVRTARGADAPPPRVASTSNLLNPHYSPVMARVIPGASPCNTAGSRRVVMGAPPGSHRPFSPVVARQPAMHSPVVSTGIRFCAYREACDPASTVPGTRRRMSNGVCYISPLLTARTPASVRALRKRRKSCSAPVAAHVGCRSSPTLRLGTR